MCEPADSSHLTKKRKRTLIIMIYMIAQDQNITDLNDHKDLRSSLNHF